MSRQLRQSPVARFLHVAPWRSKAFILAQSLKRQFEFEFRHLDACTSSVLGCIDFFACASFLAFSLASTRKIILPVRRRLAVLSPVEGPSPIEGPGR